MVRQDVFLLMILIGRQKNQIGLHSNKTAVFLVKRNSINRHTTGVPVFL
ncbi:hypothetical protein UNSWDHB_1038 [Dehalobacter sp. UNSWDHB]|nr:hypothetical protein UNSWDHB_1038 [Dehalobacter sp. UNSWDHB]